MRKISRIKKLVCLLMSITLIIPEVQSTCGAELGSKETVESVEVTGVSDNIMDIFEAVDETEEVSSEDAVGMNLDANTNPGIINKQHVDQFLVDEIMLIRDYDTGISEFYCFFKNEASNNAYVRNVQFLFYKNSSLVASVNGRPQYYSEERSYNFAFTPGQKRSFVANTTQNLMDATNLVIKIQYGNGVTAGNLIRPTNVGNYSINNITVAELNGFSAFRADVKYNGTRPDHPKYIFAKIYNHDGTRITTLVLSVGETITPGSVKTAEGACDTDITDASYATYEVIYNDSQITQSSKQYLISVKNASNNFPIPIANVSGSGKCVTTNSSGKVTITRNDPYLLNAVISKNGFKTKSLSKLNLTAGKENVVYLEPNKALYTNDILPSMRQTVQTSGPQLSVGGKKVNIFDLNYNVDIDIKGANLKVKVEKDDAKQQYKVSFGMDADKMGYSNGYDTIKDTLKAAARQPDSAKMNDIMSKKLKPTKFSVGTEITGYVGGYATITYAGNIVESGMLWTIKGKDSLTYRPAAAGGVFYGKLTLGLNADGTFKWQLDETNDVVFSSTLGIEAELGIAVGAGVDAAHLELGATGAIKTTVTFPYRDMYNSLKVTTKAQIYGEAKVFCFKSKVSKNWNGTLWPNTTKNGSTLMDFSLNQSEMMDRTYLTDSTAQFGEEKVGGQDIFYPSLENVYSEGCPQLVNLDGDKKLLIWINDNGLKTGSNRTTLMYSAYSAGTWSNPEPVSETGAGDYYPQICSENGKAYLVWNTASKIFTDDVTEEQMCANMETRYAEFDGDQFINVETIPVTKGTLQINPKIAVYGKKKVVSWIENTENDPYMLTGTNTIVTIEKNEGEWNPKNQICTKLNSINSYDLECLNGQTLIAYAVDMDGNISTDDADIFFYDGTIKQITDDSISDTSVKLLDDELYWKKSSIIKSYNFVLQAGIIDTGIICQNDYDITKSSSDKKVIVYDNSLSYVNELSVAYWNEGEWGAPVEITDYNRHITKYCIAVDYDGKVDVVSDSSEILDQVVNDSPFGNTNMIMDMDVESQEFMIEDTLSYEQSQISPNNILMVHANGKNLSSYPVTGIQYSFVAKGKENQSGSLSVNVLPGKQYELDIPYQLPSEIHKTTVSVNINPCNFKDKHQMNNVAEFTYGYGDLVMDDVMSNEMGTSILITGKVKNNGCSTLENADIFINDINRNENVFQENIAKLEPGEEKNFQLQIDQTKIQFDDTYLAKTYLCQVETNEMESRYDNNEQTVEIIPQLPAEVKFEYDEISMPVKTVSELNATVIPENALDSSIIYCSDDLDVVTVDESGILFGVGQGVANITAYTEAGVCTDVCRVFVIQDEIEPYSLSVNQVDMLEGDEFQLSITSGYNGKAVYESENESIAQVDTQGLIKAVSEGITKITVRDDDKNLYDECNVTVSNNQLKYIAIEGTQGEINEGDETDLSVHFFPEDTSSDKTISWSSTDKKIVSVDDSGHVIALGSGTVTIVAKTKDNISAEYELSIKKIPMWEVIFQSNSGTEVEAQWVQDFEKVVSPKVPIKEGYVFNGWFVDRNLLESWNFDKDYVNDNLILYASWTKKVSEEKFHVVFQSNGGTGIDSIIDIKKGDKITLPEPPTKEGFLFEGWFLDEDCTVEFGESTKIYQNVIAYAKWTEKEQKDVYTVVFETDGGNEIEKQNVLEGDKLLKPIDPVKEGYAFAGWFTEKGMINQWDFEINTVGQDLILYAMWKKTSCTITWDYRNGEPTAIQRNIAINTLVVKPNDPKFEGYIFNGWYTDIGCTKPWIFADNVVTSDIILYASWQQKYNRLIDKNKAAEIAERPEEIGYVKVSIKKDSYVYTGSEIRPKIKAEYFYQEYNREGEKTGKVKKKQLIENADYTLTYHNNIKVGRKGEEECPQILIHGIGDYSDCYICYFTITKKNIDKLKVEPIEDYVFDGTDQRQNILNKITIKDGMQELDKTDYTVEFNKDTVGSSVEDVQLNLKICATNQSNYFGVIKKKPVATILKSDQKKNNIGSEKSIDISFAQNFDIKPVIYNGKFKTPKIILKKDGKRLANNNYKLSYRNNVNAGTATVTVIGKKNFYGSKELTFPITTKDFADVKVSRLPNISFRSTLDNIQLNVTDNGKILTQDVDYIVKFELEDDFSLLGLEMKKVKAILKPISPNYTQGTQKIIYCTVIPRSISNRLCTNIMVDDATYSEETPDLGARPEVIVHYNGEVLTEGEDYTVRYSKNKKIGTANAIVTGIGDYSGKRVLKFKILRQ